MEKQSDMATLPVTQETLSAALALRYSVDADFRADFDKDPKAAVAKLLGRKISAEIVVHRNDDQCWHVTLPSQAAQAALADGDMENVSGGFTLSGSSGNLADRAVGDYYRRFGIRFGDSRPSHDPNSN